MNSVTISGTLNKFYDMTNAIVFAELVNEEGTFYLYWRKNVFKSEELIHSYVVVKGVLTYLRVKIKNKVKEKKVIAIEARSIEKYDF